MTNKETTPDKGRGKTGGMPLWATIGGIVALVAVAFACVSVYYTWIGAGEGNNWERLASSSFGIAVMGGLLWFTGMSRARK